MAVPVPVFVNPEALCQDSETIVGVKDVPDIGTSADEKDISHEKISLLKKTISEIKTISEKLDNDYVYEKKIAELNKEISRLKNGIKESAEELEDFIKEQNA